MRDRRDCRRYREPAVSGGDTAVRPRCRQRECNLYPSDVSPFYKRRIGTEDKADAALGRKTARDRHPAGYTIVQEREAYSGRAEGENSALLQCGARGGY